VLASRFKVQMVAAPVAGGPQPQAAPAGSLCALHGDAAALAICERCGDFMCPVCTTPYEGRFYCLRCFELQWQRGQLAGSAAAGGERYFLPGLALAVSVGALILWCLPVVNLFASLAALAMGAVAFANTADDRRPGRQAAIAALVFAGLAFTAAALITFVFRW